MTLPPLAVDLVSIVVRGNFKPVTISPRQLRDAGLIGALEYEQADFEVRIPNEVAVFDAGWLRCQASPDGLELRTEQEAEQERLRDLAVAVLRSSPDKPISQLGMNRNIHFPVPDIARWHAIGDHLANNAIWGKLLNASGMRNVTYWAQRWDQYGGRVQVQVEPSFSYSPGIFFSYNDHYDLTKVDSQPTTRAEVQELARTEDSEATTEKIDIAIEILTNEWSNFMQHTTSALEVVWDQARPE
jgi:hypothetical protein